MTDFEQKEAKQLEDYLNYRLDVARAAGEIPMDKILGATQIFFCTNSEKAEAWKQRNSAQN